MSTYLPQPTGKINKTVLVREEKNVDSFIFFLSLSFEEGRESTGKEKKYMFQKLFKKEHELKSARIVSNCKWRISLLHFISSGAKVFE